VRDDRTLLQAKTKIDYRETKTREKLHQKEKANHNYREIKNKETHQANDSS
jgi:hypothetical protein